MEWCTRTTQVLRQIPSLSEVSLGYPEWPASDNKWIPSTLSLYRYLLSAFTTQDVMPMNHTPHQRQAVSHLSASWDTYNYESLASLHLPCWSLMGKQGSSWAGYLSTGKEAGQLQSSVKVNLWPPITSDHCCPHRRNPRKLNQSKTSCNFTHHPQQGQLPPPSLG